MEKLKKLKKFICKNSIYSNSNVTFNAGIYEDSIEFKDASNNKGIIFMYSHLENYNEDINEIICIDLTNVEDQFSVEHSETLLKFLDDKSYLEKKDSTLVTLMFSSYKGYHKFKYYIERDPVPAKFRKKLRELLVFSQKYYNDVNNDGSQVIKIDENGTNYLKHSKNFNEEEISAYLITASLLDVFSLYEKNGPKLFDRNIRYNLTKAISNPLTIAFETQIRKDFYKRCEYLLKKAPFNDNTTKDLIHDFFFSHIKCDIDVLSDNTNLNNDLFWFKHNGVTIFSQKSSKVLEVNNDSINIPLKNTYVINGAQTISKTYNIYMNLELDIKKHLHSNIDLQKQLLDILKQTIKDTKLKLTIIIGNENIDSEITTGLNSQLPVKYEDIATVSEESRQITSILEKEGYTLLKQGEVLSSEKNITVGLLCRIALCIQQKPGSAKNITQTKILTELKEISSSLKNSSEVSNNTSYKYTNTLLESIKIHDIINSNWKQITNDVIVNNNKNDNIKEIKKLNKYTFSYFVAYIIYIYIISNNSKKDIDSLEINSNLELEYMKMVELILEISNNSEIDIVNYNTYKNNLLFEKMIQSMKKIEKGKYIEENTCDITAEFLFDVIKLYNENEVNKTMKASLHNSINKTLTEKKITIDNFRTISQRVGKKTTIESFPFPSKSFMSISNMINHNTNPTISVKVYPYSESEFAKYIEMEYTIFYSVMEENKIVELHYISKEKIFSKFSENAKIAYSKTISAFDNESTEEFPRISDKLTFHVRPKAKNSTDTFRFTDNGDEIPKQTFWVNSQDMFEIINQIIKDNRSVSSKASEDTGFDSK